MPISRYLCDVWRQVNKFLEKYNKTHFFLSIHFYLSHNLLSARYIWFNDSPTFSSRPNNVICPTLQNKPLFRRWTALWWWISFLRTISSGLETGNSRKGLNLANVLDGETISEIRWIWPSVPGTVHCRIRILEEHFLLRQMRKFFSLKCCWNDSIRLCSNRHWSFASTEGNRYELYHVHLKKLWPSPFRLYSLRLLRNWFI